MIYRRRPSTRGHADPKPRILLADDDAGLLTSVSTMLAADFDVAAVATDGEQAVQASLDVDPDAVVLDITMPRLDGFQAARALKRAGSRARIVFLTLHEEEEFVDKAFDCGASGYVIKSRAHRDLAGALDQVLAGRLFVPSLQSLLRLGDGGAGHAMQLHGEDRAFFEGLGRFFDRALRRGDATCIVASERIRAGLDERLRAREWTVEGSSRHPRYRVMDASEALERFMRNGLPDPDRVAEITDELNEYRRSAGEGAAPRLTIFGTMSAVLSTNGNPQAAIELERTWDRLTRELPFLTVCGYSPACFDEEKHPDLFPGACAQHWAVSHAARF